MPAAGFAPTVEHLSRVAPVTCVDLDGTLLASDLLWESLLGLIRHNPLALICVPFWLLRGRAYLKERLATSEVIQPERLPYRQSVIETVANLRRNGTTKVVLATASHITLARAVARHLGIFDEVIATEGNVNLKGKTKAKALVERFGNDFLYIGDSRDDLAVWSEARLGVVIGSKAILRRAAAVTEIAGSVQIDNAGWNDYWRALRPHHWSKNVLLFLPLLLAHSANALDWARTALGMLLFSLAASGVYVLNDLLDLASDREHPWKRFRPFASGQISIAKGIYISPILIASAVGLGGIYLGSMFSGDIALYCAFSLAYSMVLKSKPLVDVFILTSFYALRIVTGACITSTPLSHWFLSFSMFFFFSLALAKRYSELLHAGGLVDSGNSGRGYRSEDSQLLAIMGVASAFAAVIIFSFYTHSPDVMPLYPHPEPLLLISPLLLYWLMRVWLQAIRGELKEDPVMLALRDPMSYKVGIACVVCILLTFRWR